MIARAVEGMVMQSEGPELSGREQVIDVVTRLFIATDNRDWAEVRQCLDDEVLFDMSSLGGEPGRVTPETIIRGWEEGLKGLEAIHHQIGNFRVQVWDAAASLFCYGIALHYRRNPSGNDTRVFVGSYDIHLVRRGEAWKIDGFSYHSKFVTGNPALGR
jgi:3-phenylpropionate/cinnamic acid dioxygenase small subunit